MTEKEIIKALEYCKDCSANLNVEIIDLITRQQAENENLKVENQSLRSAANSLKMHYEEARAEIEKLKTNLNIELENYATEYDNKIKSEAVKQCLAKVKNYIKTHCNPYGKPDFDYDTSIKILNFIDNIVKEMAGE